MLNNELYQGNTKPVTGKSDVDGAMKIDGAAKPVAYKTAEAEKLPNDSIIKNDQAAHRAEEGEYAGDSARKNDLDAKPVAGDKPEILKPVGDGSVRKRIEAAWDGKQPEVTKPVSEKTETITPAATPVPDKTPAAYPEVKPIIK